MAHNNVLQGLRTVGQQRCLLPSPVACVSDKCVRPWNNKEKLNSTRHLQQIVGNHNKPHQTNIDCHRWRPSRHSLSLRRTPPLLARTCHTSSVPGTVLSAILWWRMMECSKSRATVPATCAGHPVVHLSYRGPSAPEQGWDSATTTMLPWGLNSVK